MSNTSFGDQRPPRWSLRLLGGFELVALPGGTRVPSPGKRERVLLAYLALSRNCRQPRHKLGTLIWGDLPENASLHNLRTCVWNLRRLLGDGNHRLLASDGEDILLNASAFDVDALTFVRCAESSRRTDLQAAADLYHGELLAGLSIDSEEFESWRRTAVAYYRKRAIDVLTKLMTQLCQCGDVERAIETGMRVLSLDPLHEAIVRHLMRLYGESGRRGAAADLYHTLDETLRRELDARPEPETRLVFKEIASSGDTADQQRHPQIARNGTTESFQSPAVEQIPASVAETISLAVLPFANMSGDANQEFFSDGLTEEIGSALAKVPALRIVARSSTFAFKNQNREARAVGQALGATHLIEGSVRQAGSRVRITAQLIEAKSGLQLWSESYDRDLTDIFLIQEDISQAIASALRVSLGLQHGDRLVSSRTKDIQSHDDYLRARALYRARLIADAIKILEPMVVGDPGFAPAWSLLARAYILDAFHNPALRRGAIEEARWQAQSCLRKAEVAARQAIQLDPRGSDGYAGLVFVKNFQAQWTAAEDIHKQALELDPYNTEIIESYSVLLAATGHVERAMRIAERLCKLDPFVPQYKLISAHIMQTGGQHQVAISTIKATMRDAGVTFLRSVYLAQAYAALAYYADAAKALRANKKETLVSEQSIQEAARLLQRLPSKIKNSKSLPTLQGELNFVYAHVGALDAAMEFPERYLKMGFIDPLAIVSLWSPEFAAVRTTARFKDFLRNAGLVDYWRERGWPDLCRPENADDFQCE